MSETSSSPETFFLPIRVYIEDTDAGGIVLHSQYINFMERARTEFARGLGFGKNFVHHRQLMMVVHSLDVKYLQSAELDDILQVEAVPIELKRASITFKQNIYREKELLVQGHVKVACIDKAARKPVAIPAPIYEVMKKKREVL